MAAFENPPRKRDAVLIKREVSVQKRYLFIGKNGGNFKKGRRWVEKGHDWSEKGTFGEKREILVKLREAENTYTPIGEHGARRPQKCIFLNILHRTSINIRRHTLEQSSDICAALWTVTFLIFYIVCLWTPVSATLASGAFDPNPVARRPTPWGKTPHHRNGEMIVKSITKYSLMQTSMQIEQYKRKNHQPALLVSCCCTWYERTAILSGTLYLRVTDGSDHIGSHTKASVIL